MKVDWDESLKLSAKIGRGARGQMYRWSRSVSGNGCSREYFADRKRFEIIAVSPRLVSCVFRLGSVSP